MWYAEGAKMRYDAGDRIAMPLLGSFCAAIGFINHSAAAA
jgi:hypothetical protein